MKRKTIFRLALTFVAGAAGPTAAQRRAESGWARREIALESSVGHFHFERGFDLGPPGSSIGASSPRPLGVAPEAIAEKPRPKSRRRRELTRTAPRAFGLSRR